MQRPESKSGHVPNEDPDLPPFSVVPKRLDEASIEAFARACIVKQSSAKRPNGVIIYLAKQVIRLIAEKNFNSSS